MLRFLKRKPESAEQALASALSDYELPTFPATAMHTLKLLRDPNTSMKQVTDALEVDPGMQVRILRTVNSAAFGLSSRISNLQHAATMLGRSRLESLVVSVAVKDVLPTVPHRDFDSQFWLCASRRACLGRAVAEILHPTTQTEAFAACLLQDIAVPVLFTTQEAYRDVYRQWLACSAKPLVQLERETLGYDHAAVGRLLAKQWELGDYLISAISDHHNPAADVVEPAVVLSAPLRPDPTDDGSSTLIDLAHDTFDFCRERMAGLLQESAKNAAECARLISTS